MSEMKIHVLHTGEVCVSPDLPFGGEDCSAIKASGVFQKKSERLWLPVSVYLIEHPKGLILFDTGWNREMSPEGTFDKRAQIKSLGTVALYEVNQGRIGKGMAVNEQLEKMGIKSSDLDYVVLSHLDCDHANGLKQVKDAKNILVSKDEVVFASKLTNKIRYNKEWWEGVDLTEFEWNGTDGPFHRSYDLFNDGSVKLINIPGHADGQVAMQLFNEEGKFVLLFADGGYARKSWEELITSGIAADKEAQKKSLEWIREQSLSEKCVESLANHDPDIIPHEIIL